MSSDLGGRARALSADPNDADDLVQDTVERALRNSHRFTGGNFRGWLHQIMRHMAVDSFRRFYRERRGAVPAS